jgi:hypothetical protein
MTTETDYDFQDLEDDPSLHAFREQRIEQMKREYLKKKNKRFDKYLLDLRRKNSSLLKTTESTQKLRKKKIF